LNWYLEGAVLQPDEIGRRTVDLGDHGLGNVLEHVVDLLAELIVPLILLMQLVNLHLSQLLHHVLQRDRLKHTYKQQQHHDKHMKRDLIAVSLACLQNIDHTTHLRKVNHFERPLLNVPHQVLYYMMLFVDNETF